MRSHPHLLLGGYPQRVDNPLTSATARFIAAISPLSDEQMAAPSRLPGWSRGHVATHIARNADAMVNICTWAKTGVQTPMYASVAERDSAIEAGAHRSAAEILADVTRSSIRLAKAIESLDEKALTATVRRGAAGAGPAFPASSIPWMRLREVEIHLVDLDLVPTFAQSPLDFLTSLLAEEVPNFDGRISGLVLMCAEGSRFQIGDGKQAIRGAIGDITAWLLGRAKSSEIARLASDQPIPAPPKWL
jgi:maleylpyruvate isomerase